MTLIAAKAAAPILVDIPLENGMAFPNACSIDDPTCEACQ